MLVDTNCERAPVACDSPFIQKPISLVDTAFNLYGFLPEDDDPRWSFLEKFDKVRHAVGFKAINFANAWGATYLSDDASYRIGFVNSANRENNLQLDRALDNLAYVGDVFERFTVSDGEFPDVEMQLTQTDRLTADHDESETITPCPEALYQIRLHDGDYLARVGFNLHEETGSTVLSIVNIQGTLGAKERNAGFEAEHGVSPFNLLVRRALCMARSNQPTYEVRGMVNPDKGNPRLYWGVLSKEDVKMYHAHRKVDKSLFADDLSV